METFWVLQALDIYYTYKAVKYDCVVEMNPLLPNVPDLKDLVLHKTWTLWPFAYWDYNELLTNEDMQLPIAMYVYVIANNFDTLNEAKRRCNLR